MQRLLLSVFHSGLASCKFQNKKKGSWALHLMNLKIRRPLGLYVIPKILKWGVIMKIEHVMYLTLRNLNFSQFVILFLSLYSEVLKILETFSRPRQSQISNFSKFQWLNMSAEFEFCLTFKSDIIGWEVLQALRHMCRDLGRSKFLQVPLQVKCWSSRFMSLI